MSAKPCQIEDPPMYVAYAAVLLLVFTAGCARARPDTPAPVPQVVATQPGKPEPARTAPAPVAKTPAPIEAKPVAAAPVTPKPVASAPAAATPAVPKPATSKPIAPKPVASTPAAAKPATSKPVASTPAASKPVVSKPAAPAPVAPRAAAAATPTLDLAELKERLRATKAIGVFTKISLKNQVDDLLDHFGDYYKGKAKLTMTELRRSYDLLMMKVLTLLQDDDQRLASAIVSSREAIWRLLADPTTFANLIA
jgi:hypothetical protein